MKWVSIIAFVLLMSSLVSAKNIEMTCENQSFLGVPLQISVADSGLAKLSQPSCSLDFIKLMDQKNYINWGLFKTKDSFCLVTTKLGASPVRSLQEIILSDEVLEGQPGFVRIAVDNKESEYGPLTIKTFLHCR